MVPSSGSTRKNVAALTPWVAACSSVTMGISGKAARRPAAISASARSSASVTGEASDFDFTANSGAS